MFTIKQKTPTELGQIAKTVIKKEGNAILNLANTIDESFINACQEILNCQGKIIVLGMGKSGHIAKKIAATFASTGTPAFFIHPSEASHGDIGVIAKNDVAIILSNSGNTNEIITILPCIISKNIPIIAITNNALSELAKYAKFTINTLVQTEACSLDLVPTTSSTTALVIGDALALTCLQARNFTNIDFAKNHPGGSLGKKLTLTVSDIMHSNDKCPTIHIDKTLREALLEITNKKLGFTVILESNNTIAGIFTDGDLRRVLDQNVNLNTSLIKDHMTIECKKTPPNTLAYDALKNMSKHKITSLLVTDVKEKLLGAIHIHDILNTGISY